MVLRGSGVWSGTMWTCPQDGAAMVTSQQPATRIYTWHSVTMFCLPSEQSADTAMGPAARMQATFKYEIGSQENCYLLL